ncbi:MAG: hypothetical protein JMN27_06330 [gamma proteobacterium endosymbiont of Lamellibrachia anaximandri]|nr:hypothetical protein [gamma proteobacterium endosymbiont of Lamellibrachia anaximandri]MBL3533434.1 hypothetical protein [gamma proteobacterium endosymbiont of Lamellibrachia anaximandri]MBL3598861.1 hypothetical protein [gamma proteobacterium endosymbiont of Lamellibrachia anaximandri]
MVDGSRITIDPITNKATRSAEGVSSQLWDGVHRLDNGAVIIVRDGVVVRDAILLESQQQQLIEEEREACSLLVRKVCGQHDECRGHPACNPARQLLALEQEEAQQQWDGRARESSRLCLDALRQNDFFQACTKRQSGTPLSSCEVLRQKVCGTRLQCAGTQACDLAKQLFLMEMDEQVFSPDIFTQTGAQCREALGNTDLFSRCD